MDTNADYNGPSISIDSRQTDARSVIPKCPNKNYFHRITHKRCGCCKICIDEWTMDMDIVAMHDSIIWLDAGRQWYADRPGMAWRRISPGRRPPLWTGRRLRQYVQSQWLYLSEAHNMYYIIYEKAHSNEHTTFDSFIYCCHRYILYERHGNNVCVPVWCLLIFPSGLETTIHQSYRSVLIPNTCQRRPTLIRYHANTYNANSHIGICDFFPIAHPYSTFRCFRFGVAIYLLFVCLWLNFFCSLLIFTVFVWSTNMTQRSTTTKSQE